MNAQRKSLILVALLIAEACVAQVTKHPGSQYLLEEKAAESEGFCVAILKDHGIFGLGPSGCAYHSQINMEVRHNFLMGEFQTARCGITLRSYPPEKIETLPAIGKPYLLIGRFGSDRLAVDKIVDPTPENIKIVERVIRERNLPINPQPYLPAESGGPSEAREEAPGSTAAPPRSETVPRFEIKPMEVRNEMPSAPLLWGMIGLLILTAIGGLLWCLLRARK